MLATSKNVLLPGQNHHYWWPFILIITLAGARVIIKVSGHQYRWLAGGYDLEIGHFLEVASMVVTWWIMAFCTWIPYHIYHMKKRYCNSVREFTETSGSVLKSNNTYFWNKIFDQWITRIDMITKRIELKTELCPMANNHLDNVERRRI